MYLVGTRKMGLQSLPVAFGVETAKWITVGTIDITQAAVAAYLFFGLNEPLYGAILTALVLPQVFALTYQHLSVVLVHACVYGFMAWVCCPTSVAE